jgi:hypothetical protein
MKYYTVKLSGILDNEISYLFMDAYSVRRIEVKLPREL